MGLGKTLTMLCAIIGTIDEAREASQNMGLQDHFYLTAERPLIPSRATLVVVPSYCKHILSNLMISANVRSALE